MVRLYHIVVSPFHRAYLIAVINGLVDEVRSCSVCNFVCVMYRIYSSSLCNYVLVFDYVETSTLISSVIVITESM